MPLSLMVLMVAVRKVSVALANNEKKTHLGARDTTHLDSLAPTLIPSLHPPSPLLLTSPLVDIVPSNIC